MKPTTQPELYPDRIKRHLRAMERLLLPRPLFVRELNDLVPMLLALGRQRFSVSYQSKHKLTEVSLLPSLGQAMEYPKRVNNSKSRRVIRWHPAGAVGWCLELADWRKTAEGCIGWVVVENGNGSVVLAVRSAEGRAA